VVPEDALVCAYMYRLDGKVESKSEHLQLGRKFKSKHLSSNGSIDFESQKN